MKKRYPLWPPTLACGRVQAIRSADTKSRSTPYSSQGRFPTGPAMADQPAVPSLPWELGQPSFDKPVTHVFALLPCPSILQSNKRTGTRSSDAIHPRRGMGSRCICDPHPVREGGRRFPKSVTLAAVDSEGQANPELPRLPAAHPVATSF